MTRKEIEALHMEIVTLETLEEIELSPEVVSVDNIGNSGYHIGCIWFSVEFENGETVDVYAR